MNSKIEIELFTSSTEVSMKELNRFTTGLKVFNKSDEALYFDVSETILFVNSHRNVSWDLAVQNGTIINFNVLPQQEKLVEWPIGKALFDSPGKYNLELHWKAIIKSCDIFVSE
jgi:hypothetical protein